MKQNSVAYFRKLFKGKKILILDLETSPNEGYFWRPGKQVVTHKQIQKERQIICASYKWAGEKEVDTLHFGLKKQDDTTLLRQLTKIINSANIIVGQNSDKFDLPWVQGRLFIKQLPPILTRPALVSLDTLKLSRNSLGLNAYRLDYLSKLMGLGGKIRMEYDDWVDIMSKKCPVAFAKMLKYCPKDVNDTETILYKMLPYVRIPSSLSKVLSGHTIGCTKCGSLNYGTRGSGSTNAGVLYSRCLCNDCGSWFKGPKL